MKRRDFIKMGSFITVSVAALGVTACGSSSDDNSTTTTTNPNRPMPPAATGANWLFPQSVASGDPKSDSLMFWTRVTPSSIPATDFATVTSVSTAVLLRVTTTDNSASLGTNAALTGTLVAEVTVPAYSDFDGTIRHKLTGLTPDTVYYYQFVAGTVTSNVGRTKTAPAASSTADVKFAFMSCQDWNANHWGAFTQIVADDGSGATPSLDFIVHLGDYIYETPSDTVAVEALHTAHTLPSGSTTNASTTNDYRYLYKRYRSDSRLQRMHERFPMVAIWDDHEFSDDCWQDHETYTNANAEQLSRRRSANQGWFEFTAADITYSEVDTGFQNIKIYRDLKFGQTMHLVMTDERLYRADHMIPENTIPTGSTTELGRINTRYLAPEPTYKLIESIKYGLQDDPLAAMTMLGTTQRAWWKTTMSGSTATWKVWGNEVSLLRMGLNGVSALATLLGLNAATTIGTNISNTASAAPPAGTGGNIPVASAIVGAVAAGAAPATAAAAGQAIAVAAATSGDKQAAAVGAGLTANQATVAVTGFNTATATAGLGAANQIAATAFTIGKTEVSVGKTNSVIFNQAMTLADTGASLPAGTSKAKVSPFFQKFLLNADQWDGYQKERKELMNHLLTGGIQNVVAITGDIHAFFAGQVYNDFAGEVTGITAVGGNAVEASAATAGTAALVDLVTAGISSTSWFNYIKQAADGLDPTNSLIGKLVYVPVAVPANAPFPAFTVYANMLNYSMGKPISPTDATAAANQLAGELALQIRAKLSGFGAPEAAVDTYTAGYVANIAANATFKGQAVPLAQQLSAMGQGVNPWLKHIDTEAQGYSVVTASSSTLTCVFKKLNPLVGTAAPATPIVRSTKTATITAGAGFAASLAIT